MTTLLSALGRAVSAMRLYDADHPLVRSQLDAAAAALAGAVAQGELEIGVAPASFFVGSDELREPHELCQLATTMHRLDLAVVRVRAGADAAALRTAVQAWADASRQRAIDPAALAEQIHRDTDGAVRCLPLDYEGMQTREDARARDNGAGSSWTWSGLIDHVLHPGTSGDGGGGEQDAAAWVAQRVAQDADGGLRLLHAQLHDAASKVAQGDAPQRGAAMQRMHEFLAALTPDLREVLLSASAGGQVEHAEACDNAASTRQVLTALSSLDGHLTLAARQSLMMCAKLADLSSKYVHTPESATAPRAEADDITHTLEELLELHDPAEHTPADYLRRLEQIAAGDVGTRQTAVRDEYAALFEAGKIRGHAAQIAIHLAGAYLDEEGRCAEPMRYLARNVDDLARAGMAASVASAARVAEARLNRGGDDAALDAARRVIERITACVADNALFDRLLAEPGTDTADLATLLRLGGPEQIDTALHRVATENDAARTDALLQALRGAGAAALSPALQQFAQTHPQRLLDLLPRLGPLPFKAVTRWLGARLTQGTADERRKAFRVLRDASPTWPADAAQTLLAHPDQQVRELTLGQLLWQDDPATVHLLGRFLAGRVTGRVPTADEIRRVADALVRRGDPGLDELAAAMHSLGGVFHPRRSMAAAQVAQFLSHSGHPRAVELAERWTRSPSAIWARWSVDLRHGDAA